MSLYYFIMITLFYSSYLQAYKTRFSNQQRKLEKTYLKAGEMINSDYVTIPIDEVIKDVISVPVSIKSPSKYELRNIYYGIRHGESEANKAGELDHLYDYS